MTRPRRILPTSHRETARDADGGLEVRSNSLRHVYLLTLVVTCLAACAASPPPPSERAALPAATAREPQLADGVTAMEAACDETIAERCDGIDTNCDGQIDEGCDGAVSSDVVLALAWSDGQDLDLIIEGPTTFETTRASGTCEGTAGVLERAWVSDAAPGLYTVRVRRVDACGLDTPATVSLSMTALARGRGVFNRTLGADETEATLVTFELAP